MKLITRLWDMLIAWAEVIHEHRSKNHMHGMY